MNGENLRVGQLEGVKMVAYQLIQQSKQKLFSRLAYLLLEHIVEQYQTNEYLRLAMAGSLSTAKQIISDSIQLYMQQRIQQKSNNSSNKGKFLPKMQQKVKKTQQKELNAHLQERIIQLTRDNETLRNSYQKQRRKVSKLLQKYNHLSDLMFEMKEKGQNQLKDLQRSYQVRISDLNSKNNQLRQQVIRLDVTLQFMMKTGSYVNTCLAKSPTENTMMSFVSYQQNKVNTEKNLCINRIFSIKVPQKTKKLEISSIPCLVKIEGFRCQDNQKIQETQDLITESAPQINVSIQTSLELQRAQSKLQRFTIQKASLADFQMQTGFTSLSNETQTDQEQSHQLQKFREQLRVSNYLSETFQKHSTRYKLECCILSEQKMELIKISNKCIEENQSNRIQLNEQIRKLEVRVCELEQQVQRVQEQKIDLLNLIQQFHVIPNHSQGNTQELKNTQNQHSQSEYTEESSTQPKKEPYFYFQLNTNDSTLERGLNPQLSIDEYIRKQTISRYFLQLLDYNCKGEAKLILLDQIGECLGWNLQDYERLEFYRQNVRLKKTTFVTQQEREGGKDNPNLKDKIYRFLTNESETEE